MNNECGLKIFYKRKKNLNYINEEHKSVKPQRMYERSGRKM